jgi:hypothetical protein
VSAAARKGALTIFGCESMGTDFPKPWSNVVAVS